MAVSVKVNNIEDRTVLVSRWCSWRLYAGACTHLCIRPKKKPGLYDSIIQNLFTETADMELYTCGLSPRTPVSFPEFLYAPATTVHFPIKWNPIVVPQKVVARRDRWLGLALISWSRATIPSWDGSERYFWK